MAVRIGIRRSFWLAVFGSRWTASGRLRRASRISGSGETLWKRVRRARIDAGQHDGLSGKREVGAQAAAKGRTLRG